MTIMNIRMKIIILTHASMLCNNSKNGSNIEKILIFWLLLILRMKLFYPDAEFIFYVYLFFTEFICFAYESEKFIGLLKESKNLIKCNTLTLK